MGITQRFEKDVLSIGRFRHPSGSWELDVDGEFLSHLVTSFRRMREEGVPIKFTKDHGTGSDAVLGEVVDMTIERGGTLVATVEARGEASIELCERIDHASCEIEKDFVDGRGNEYGKAIVAVSVTPDPVVPGQRPFVKIAASRLVLADDSEVRLARLTAEMSDSVFGPSKGQRIAASMADSIFGPQ